MAWGNWYNDEMFSLMLPLRIYTPAAENICPWNIDTYFSLSNPNLPIGPKPTLGTYFYTYWSERRCADGV